MIPLLSWLFDVTLKGSLLILLVAAILQLLGSRLDPRWRHLLWLVVLVRLLMPVAPTASWSLFNLMRSADFAPPMEILIASPERMLQDFPARVTHQSFVIQPSIWREVANWFFAIWIAGVIVMMLRTLLASLRAQHAVTLALRRSDANGKLQSLIEEAARELGIRRRVRGAECDLVQTPALHGLLRPVILLPAGLASSFTQAELRNIVLHELWHQRRLDVAVSWLLSAVQALHWFNPIVWFAASRIREERELACDELSLSCLEREERIGYGMTILKLLERFRAAAPVPALTMGMVGIINEKKKMKRRMSMIASFRNRTRFSTLLLVTVVAVAAIGLTDASGGETHKRIMRKLDPAAIATFEKLDQKISFELNNATFAELLNAISNRTGLLVTQSPDLATNDVQKARFTIKAEGVPAHLALMEALWHFELAPHPGANGIEITAGHAGMKMRHGPGTFEKRVRVTSGAPDGEERMIEVEVEAGAETGDKIIHGHGEGVLHEGPRMMIRRHASGEPGKKGEVDSKVIISHSEGPDAPPDGDGHIRRNVTLSLEENGVKSEGKFSMDIDPN